MDWSGTAWSRSPTLLGKAIRQLQEAQCLGIYDPSMDRTRPVLLRETVPALEDQSAPATESE